MAFSVYTGNISTLLAQILVSTVYPCVYREHTLYFTKPCMKCGLSLCIQGTLLQNIVCQSKCPVYPCVYREHNANPAIRRCELGLSLCIQGTLFKKKVVARKVRFIPVYTGNTKKRMLHLGVRPVYPCVYREHSNYNILFYN